jgi:hypothetical protein
MAGREWPNKARAALIGLCVQGELVVSAGVQLLSDIHTIFEETGVDKLPTAEMLERLVAIEDDKPWPLWWAKDVGLGNLKGPAARLARLLKPYKIQPHTIKLSDGSTAKGYHRGDFEEPWRRYLSVSAKADASALYPAEVVTNVTNVTCEGETGDVEGNGYVKDVTEQDNVTDFPSKVTRVTRVTSYSGHEARRSLSALLTAIQGTKGLHPAGHPDCVWGEEYPAQHMRALDYVANDGNDEQRALSILSRLVHKIQHCAVMGRPLTTGPGALEWRDGSYPEAFTAARQLLAT